MRRNVSAEVTGTLQKAERKAEDCDTEAGTEVSVLRRTLGADVGLLFWFISPPPEVLSACLNDHTRPRITVF